MDYMNLGVQSRKTGLKVRSSLTRDEYSMENINDFFGDDDSRTSTIAKRRQSRKSSLLPYGFQGKSVLSEQSSTSPAKSDSNRGFKVPKSRISSPFPSGPDFTPDSHVPVVESLSPEDGAHLQSPRRVEKRQVNSFATRLSAAAQRRYSTHYELEDSANDISLASKRSASNLRLENNVPDLISDDEDDEGIASTSLNTSDNAVLEHEIDDEEDTDDFVLESEEDHEYIDEHQVYETKSDTNSVVSPERDNDELSSSSSNYSSDSDDGSSIAAPGRISSLRRSKRVKIAPLEYWRNEKIVYKRANQEPVLNIDKVITYERDDRDEEDLMKKNRVSKTKPKVTRARPYTYIPTGKKRGRPRKESGEAQEPGPDINRPIIDEIKQGKYPNSEWLQHGILESEIKGSDDTLQKEIVAYASSMSQAEQLKDTKDENFSLEILFDTHKEHFASGILKLPVLGRKQTSESNSAFMTFFIVQGVVEVTLANRNFITTEGCSFQIPAMNSYAFENKGNNEARMFFVQVIMPDDRLVKQSRPQISSESEDEEKMFDSARNHKSVED